MRQTNHYFYFFSINLIERRKIMISKKNVKINEATTVKRLSITFKVDERNEITTKKKVKTTTTICRFQ